MRNFSSVWNRLPAHAWRNNDEQIKWLDANLRRINAWSTALQYLENTLTEVNTDA
jgi:hypothetical protein